MTQAPDRQAMVAREHIANRSKHWVRLVTACNNKCLFCLDMDTPRNVYLSADDVKAELRKGREELDAWKVILSGGEASLHPLFPEFIRYAHEIGYGRVQTVTNGLRYAERKFFAEVIDAGLNEITFSLHGHTAELHDHLVQTPGSFKRLMKGMIRALRDGRPIVNVDVVINKQNVGYIDRIVELCASLGVREFDLLHVIPQSAAFENRDVLFYDVREHLPRLQKVFELNRKGFYIWTNRFPVSFLEGMEDLIQDPHKMLDEVNGRRYHVRRYLDEGVPLECRQPERCTHCFIEPFCSTMDRVIERQNQEAWQIWWLGDGRPGDDVALPYGCRQLGLALSGPGELAALALPPGAGLYATLQEIAGFSPDQLPGDGPWTLVANASAHLEALLTPAVLTRAEVVVELNRETGAWLLAHRDRLAALLPACGERILLWQPTHEKMETALDRDVADPRGLFEKLGLRVRAAGLPACLAPGAILAEPPALLPASLFEDDSGRLGIRALARWHVANRYPGKSVRCGDCRVTERCEGLHINAARARGLRQLKPLRRGAWADDADAQLRARWPEPPPRLSRGSAPQPVAPSLPGAPPPAPAPIDPLADPDVSIKRSDLLKQRSVNR